MTDQNEALLKIRAIAGNRSLTTTQRIETITALLAEAADLPESSSAPSEEE